MIPHLSKSINQCRTLLQSFNIHTDIDCQNHKPPFALLKYTHEYILLFFLSALLLSSCQKFYVQCNSNLTKVFKALSVFYNFISEITLLCSYLFYLSFQQRANTKRSTNKLCRDHSLTVPHQFCVLECGLIIKGPFIDTYTITLYEDIDTEKNTDKYEQDSYFEASLPFILTCPFISDFSDQQVYTSIQSCPPRPSIVHKSFLILFVTQVF